jgi:YesN/AraC family two-component response regulator
MNTLVDVSKLGSISVVKRLNSLLAKLFGLKLYFYGIKSKDGKSVLEDKAALKKMFKGYGSNLIKDVKKSVSKKELIVCSVSSKSKRVIVPVMVKKKVYGVAFTDEINIQKNISSKSKSPICLTDTHIKELCSFLEEFVNFIFALKFEEIVFLSSDMAQTHLQESISKALDYIKDNYYRPNLSLSEVSEAVNLSPYYFSHQFKKEYNTTFIEFVTRIRLEAALKLLKDMRLSVAQVSFAVGYQDPNYFSKVFKKWMNISPQEYRDQIVDQKIS